jgi:hypothetical protein
MEGEIVEKACMKQIIFQSVNPVVFFFLWAASAAAPLSIDAATCVPPPTNMVSWWRAEGNLIDSWDSNSGTAIVGPAYGTGQVGLGLSNSVISVPDAPSLHFTSGLTVLAWINGSAFANGGLYTIVSKYEVPFTSNIATQSSFYFGITNNGNLFFRVSSNGQASANVGLSATQTILPHQWYLVAATYDHTHLRLYINGQLSVARDFFTGIFPGTTPLGIGGVPSGTPPFATAAFPFAGTIDEVSLFNRALSQTEIFNIYSADGAGLCLAAPTITGPASQAVPLNEDAVFSVSVLGNRPLSYQWRFNGTNLLGATSSTLYLERVQSNRVGNYSVLVSNQVGSATSQVATLTLLPPPACVPPPPGIISWWPADGSANDVMGTNNAEILPPFFLNGYTTGKVSSAFDTAVTIPNSASLNFGSNADFSWEGWIKVAPTNPFSLFRNSTNDSIAEKFLNSVGYTLSLRNGQLALELGFAPLSLAGVHTFIAPGVDLRDGHYHHVACTVSRTAAGGSHLYVDGVNVLNFDLSHFSGSLSNASVLRLGFGSAFTGRTALDAVTDEMTLYGRPLAGAEVAAIYHAGSAGKCKEPPHILQQPLSQTVTETSNATFTVSASGLGLHYQWRFNGLNIAGATTASLGLTNVSIANTGDYSVRINNGFGAITRSIATLLVHRLPVALCSNVVTSADGACRASASVDAGSFDPDGFSITISQSPPGPYLLGTNLVTLTVAEASGLSVSCNSLVLVLDTTPPIIACPSDVTTEFDDEHGARVSFIVQANDNCSGVVPVISVPPSGSVFPIGTNSVSNSATDQAGNIATCAFQVAVLGSQGVLSNVLADLSALGLTLSRRPDAHALDSAIENLGDSLDPSLWLDQVHITRSHGEQVFNNDKAAIQDLYRILKEKQNAVNKIALQAIIDRIVKSDRLLAIVAIQDALAAGADARKLNQALDKVANGDLDIADAKYEAGISQYRNAWKDAVQQSLKVTAHLASGQPLLEFEAAPGDTFIIEISTDLIEWTELGTISAGPDGTVRFQDENSAGADRRFYRVKQVQ